MDHVLASVLMDLLLGLLSRAVMLLNAGALLTGTWAGACWGGCGESYTSVHCV